MPDSASYRLPRTVLPQRYDLTLTPDLRHASFAGEARIRVSIAEGLQEIILNSVELQILSASLTGPDGAPLGATVTFDEAEERATLHLDGTAAPGIWEIDLTFTGALNDKLLGFYRSTFKDAEGTEHVIATTQFEATAARRAFPCWDEPDFKATFAVTLIVDHDLTAISNCSVVSDKDLGNGKRQVTFAETMPMSTYLVAFVIGPFELSEAVEVDGVPMRIAATASKSKLTDFGAEIGAFSLQFLADYFDIAYPSDKIDHIAIPDFAFGAMENLGCVTYRETALLVDKQAASRVELQRVAQVVSHETAHMWFGDLVTMKWWNGIWLNEAFATFMELKTVDDFRPEWGIWVNFGLYRSAAMTVDGLSSTRPVEFAVGRPDEAEAMFDILTYQKGSAVLRMLEQYLGADSFREGISRYLKEHSYGNTETTDLWDAIEAASGEPARAVMDSWIDQPGYPMVSADLTDDGAHLVLSQARFVYSGDGEGGLWQVPINLRLSLGGVVSQHRVLLTEPTTTVDLGGSPDWVVVNAGGWGFYRVRYAGSLLARLRAVIGEPPPAGLEPLERLMLVSDAWAAVVAGDMPLLDFLRLAEQMPNETDPDVWQALLVGLQMLDIIVSDTDRPLLQALVRHVVGPAVLRLGRDPVPDEPERAGTLRARLLTALGGLGADADTTAWARSRLDQYLVDRTTLAPDLVSAVVSIVAQAGGELEYTVLLDRYRLATTPQDKVRYLYALAAPESAALLTRTLELCLTDEVRSQDAPYVLGAILASRVGAVPAWEFLEEHWDTITSRFPSNSVPRMLEGITALADPVLALAIHAFLADHPVRHQKPITQSLERLDINVAFARRIADELPAALRQA